MALVILALTLHGVGDGGHGVGLESILTKLLSQLDGLQFFPSRGYCMLLFKCTQTSWRRKCKPKLFRFESMWLRDNQCDDWSLMHGNREKAWGLHPFNTCLDECRDALTHWNKTTFGHVGKKISTLRKKL